MKEVSRIILTKIAKNEYHVNKVWNSQVWNTQVTYLGTIDLINGDWTFKDKKDELLFNEDLNVLINLIEDKYNE